MVGFVDQPMIFLENRSMTRNDAIVLVNQHRYQEPKRSNTRSDLSNLFRRVLTGILRIEPEIPNMPQFDAQFR
jgi:hypothetical protein